MPTLLQTTHGRVTALWGSALIRGAGGKMHALKVGDIVNRGDVILTTQDGIVELAPERGTGVATTSPNDVDRVITGLNESNPSDAPAAVLGGDGAGDLTPGLRVDRVVESINSAALTQSSPALNGPIAAAFNNNLGAPENLNPPAAPGVVNIAPSGTAVAVSGLEDSTLPVTLAGHDPDGSIVAVTVTTIPAGSQLLLADGVTPVVVGQALTPAQAGNLLFKPGPDFNGSTAITFTVTDDAGAVSGSTSVSFNVIAVNDAPIGVADAASVVEDTPLSGNVIVNDVDVDGPALSVTSFSVAGASHAAGTTADLPGIGTLLINADGSYQFTPAANYNGPVPVATYTVTDGLLMSSATLSLSVSAVNDAPLAINDLASTPINTPVSIAVLANDSDVEGDALTLASAALVNPAQGSVTVNANGTISFTPAADFSGSAQINYSVVDSHGASSTASVTVNVGNNTSPTGTDSSGSLAEDTSYTLDAADFGFADADAGQTFANVRIDSLPLVGTLQLNGTPVSAGVVISAADIALGKLMFVPLADGNGAPYASLSFSVQDSAGAFAASPNTLTLDVTPVNDAPVALADSTSTPINTAVNISVLANDSDVDGDALSVSGASVNAAQGSVSVNPDGTLNFTPAANFSGAASISYTLSDGHGGSAIGTLSVNVGANTPPAGADATVTISEDTSKTFSAADFGFADADAGQSLAAVRIDSLPGAGALTLNGVAVAAGQVVAASDIAGLVFAPAADASGNGYASFSFSVQDSAGAFDATPNAITINVT
ncbi:MAG: tandem-95 repeat protein, partial [Betaproteobacteria bacterium]